MFSQGLFPRGVKRCHCENGLTPNKILLMNELEASAEEKFDMACMVNAD